MFSQISANEVAQLTPEKFYKSEQFWRIPLDMKTTPCEAGGQGLASVMMVEQAC